jgi:hypothetical protein
MFLPFGSLFRETRRIGNGQSLFRITLVGNSFLRGFRVPCFLLLLFASQFRSGLASS